jgi:multidrug efflux pump subunit AcrA (membrane-fusion protein)
MNRHHRAGSLFAILAAPLLLPAMLLAGCGPSKQAARQQASSVVAAPAVRSTIAISLEYPARIRPRQEIVVSPKIAGRVAAVKAEVGQAVRADQVLFTLEAGDFEAQNRQATAALGSAEANLTRTSDSSLSSQEIQAQAALKQAQVQYDDAKALADRTAKLYNDGTASLQQRDSAKARLDSAAIALDTAQQNLALLQQRAGPQSTGFASTQVDQARATADLAQSQLENTIVRSPINGVVSTRTVDPGELVSSAVPAFVVIDVSSLSAEASVEESTVRTLRTGQSVPVLIDAAGSAALNGIVETISPAADPRTQGYLVKVRVTAPPAVVRPGMFARISFPVQTRTGVLVVPNSAVFSETGVTSVFAVVDGKAKKVTVQTGISNDTVTEITAGLIDGQLVVTEGQSFLADGQSVTVAP